MSHCCVICLICINLICSISFSKDLELLGRIPLLHGLVNSDNGPLESSSLLEWINQKDCESSLELVAEKCLQALIRFDTDSLNEVKDEAEKAIENANSKDMQEIRGLEERLYGLEKLMCEAKKYSSDQTDLSNALYQNQQRASNLTQRDVSIIPDLCKSHRTQLQLMLKNHQLLRDIRRRCVQAKKELSDNLHQRLRWIMFVEKKLSDVDAKMLIYRESIRRLKKHLEMIQQVHIAPRLYISAVVEVVRRKYFSSAFLQWANQLAQKASLFQRGEVSSRNEFNTHINNHFVRTLFPGLEDLPPPFAVEAPQTFDLFLPTLSLEDIKYLRELLPELNEMLELPNDDGFVKLMNEFVAITMKSQTEDLALPEILNSGDSGSLTTAQEIDLLEKQLDKSTQSPSEVPDDEVLGGSSIENLRSDASTYTSLHINNLEETEKRFSTLEELVEEKSNELQKYREEATNSNELLAYRANVINNLAQLLKTSLTNQRQALSNVRDLCAQFDSQLKSALADACSPLVRRLKEHEDLVKTSNQLFEDTVKSSTNAQNCLRENIYRLDAEVSELSKALSEKESIMFLNSSEYEKKIRELETEQEDAIKKINLERELELEDEIKRVTSSHEEIVQSMELEVQSLKVKVKLLDEEKRTTEYELLARCQKEKEVITSTLQAQHEKEKEGLHSEFLEKISEINDGHEAEKVALTKELEEEKAKELQDLKEQLTTASRYEIENLRSRFKLAVSTSAIDRSVDSLTFGSPEERKFNLHHQVSALHKEIDDLNRRHQADTEKLKFDQQEEIKQLRASYLADKKVKTDEKLNRVVRKQEETIRNYQLRETALRESLETLKPELETQAPQLMQSFDLVAACLEDVSSVAVFPAVEMTDSFNGHSKAAAESAEKLAVLESVSFPFIIFSDEIFNFTSQLQELKDKTAQIVQLQQQLVVNVPSTLSSFDRVAVLR